LIFSVQKNNPFLVKKTGKYPKAIKQEVKFRRFNKAAIANGEIADMA